jgi:hypothetical protein
MSTLRLVAILLIFVMLASAQPIHAAEGIVEVRQDALPTPILAPEEVAKIQALQQQSLDPSLVSPISPDDAVVLTIFSVGGVPQPVALLNIQDGAIQPIALDFARYQVIAPWHWRNATTLETLAVDTTSETNPFHLQIDRTSSLISTTPFTTTLPGALLSVAPNLSKALVLVAPDQQQAPQTVSAPVGRQSAQPGSPPPLLAPWQPQPSLAPLRLTVTAEPTTLATIDLHSGVVQPLTTLPIGVALPFNTRETIAWSPAANRLAVILTGLDDRAASGFDGALLSSLIYRDAIGDFPPRTIHSSKTTR